MLDNIQRVIDARIPLCCLTGWSKLEKLVMSIPTYLCMRLPQV